MAFHNCVQNFPKLHCQAILPEIGYNAFNGTTALTTITIPKTVTKAGSDVFEDSGLKTATIENGATAVVDNLFSNAKKFN